MIRTSKGISILFGVLLSIFLWVSYVSMVHAQVEPPPGSVPGDPGYTAPAQGGTGQGNGSGGTGAGSGSGGVGQGNGSGGTGQGNGGVSGSRTLMNPLGNITIQQFFLKIIDIILIFAIPIIVFFIILAGFKYVTARGNMEDVKAATTALTWALVGGVLILGAKILLDVIQNTVNALR